MNASQIVRTALTALTVNKMRSSLTILGVVIGVAAVIALMALGEGTQVSIAQNIESMGTDLIFVNPGASSESAPVGSLNASSGAGGAMTETRPASQPHATRYSLSAAWGATMRSARQGSVWSSQDPNRRAQSASLK